MFPSLNQIPITRGNTVDPTSPDAYTSTAPRCTMQRTENTACGTCVAWDRTGDLKRTRFQDSMSPRTDRNPSTYRGKTHDAYGRKFVENDRGDLTCYAESDDGLTWTKPNLGLFEFNGNPNNNIVWDLHGACVFRDDDESDPQRRYKMIGFCRRYRNIFLLMSPDGIRWDDSDFLEPIADRDNEGAFNVIYDKKNRPIPSLCPHTW